MNYRKVDANLAASLGEAGRAEGDELTVFIQTVGAADHGQAEFLRRHGVTHATAGDSVFTGMLSARAIDEVTEQPWIRLVRLSGSLRPLATAGDHDEASAPVHNHGGFARSFRTL